MQWKVDELLPKFPKVSQTNAEDSVCRDDFDEKNQPYCASRTCPMLLLSKIKCFNESGQSQSQHYYA
ncbi:hypothetical protein TNCV_382751 [Trichonephila clavipes]|nr:hypothetical protein TNCV_382751 [Trichonephila clavipes]